MSYSHCGIERLEPHDLSEGKFEGRRLPHLVPLDRTSSRRSEYALELIAPPPPWRTRCLSAYILVCQPLAADTDRVAINDADNARLKWFGSADSDASQ